MALSYNDATRKVNSVKNLENYLALYICVKGCLDVPNNKTIDDYTAEELKEMPRKYLNSADALKLMGVKIEKNCRE